MTRGDWLELCLLYIHSALSRELDRRLHPGGIQAGVPRMGTLPQSTLLDWERDIRHAVEMPEEYWSKVEDGELEEWLRSREFAISQAESDALERLGGLQKRESDLRMRIFQLERRLEGLC